MKSPFKFLDSFTKEDKNIFFGRDNETEELYQKVFESKVLLVYGVSGTGKSSLIHCGLANKFQESDWLPINIRRGANINESLQNAINKHTISPPSGEIKRGLKNLYLDHFKPVYLIFDQFEELFIFGSKSEREDFIQTVKSITESELNCKFLFVIREEYLAGITEFEKQLPQIMQNRIRIEKMTRNNAVQVIEGPCKVAEIKVEEGFSESLLEKLSPNSIEVELTYLQVYLDKIFRTVATNESSLRGGTTKQSDFKEEIATPSSVGFAMTFNKDILTQLGNVKDLLGSFLDEQIAELETPDKGLTILKAFVSIKGTKRQITEEEVQDYARTLGKNIDIEQLKSLIQKFVALRILRDKDENNRYELRHDALAAKIYEKISTVEKELLEIRQLIENAFDTYKKRDILIGAADIKYISKFEDRISLSGDLAEFYNTSKQYVRKQQKVVKRMMAVSIFVFLFLISIVIYSGMNIMNEIQGERQAIASVLQFDNVYNKINLALDAYEYNPDHFLTRKALIHSFNLFLQTNDTNYTDVREKYLIEYQQAESNILKIKTSLDNDIIYAQTADSTIVFWNKEGEIINSVKLKNAELYEFEISPNNKYLATLYSDSTLFLQSILGDSILSLKTVFNIHNTKQVFKFTNDKLITLSKKNGVAIYNMQGSLVQSFDKYKNSAIALDVSKDNNFIAFTSPKTTVDVFYYNNIKKQYDFYNEITSLTNSISLDFLTDNHHLIIADSDSNIFISNINDTLVYNVNHFIYYKINTCQVEFSNNRIIATTVDKKNDSIFYKKKVLSSYDCWLVSMANYKSFDNFIISNNSKYVIYTVDDKSYLADNERWVYLFTIKLNSNNNIFYKDDYILSSNNNRLGFYYINTDKIVTAFD